MGPDRPNPTQPVLAAMVVGTAWQELKGMDLPDESAPG
jgi:hypothetical protein